MLTNNQRRVHLFMETIVVRAGGDNRSRNSLSCLLSVQHGYLIRLAMFSTYALTLHPLLCTPLIPSSVARDGNWFRDDYVPFRTRIHDSNGSEFEAIGIGTAIIPVEQEEGEGGEFPLRNMLHYPDAVCNIVGKPATEEYGLGYIHCAASRLLIMAFNDHPVAYFEREDGNPFRTLMLSGPPRGTRLGPCTLDGERNSMLELYWPESERERFEASQEEEEIPDPLSDLERAWLKRYWKSEFKFLAAYGLNIYYESDRSVGRDLLRQFMAEDKKLEEFNKNDMNEDESDYYDEMKRPVVG